MAASRSSQRNAREFFELKQRAVQFYTENKVPEKLEDILNIMVYEQPPDVYGRLSEYFESISKPVVMSKVCASQVLDSKGQLTLQADVYCMKRGVETFMVSSTMASFNHLTDNAPPDQRDAEDKERKESVLAAIEYIQGPISERLAGQDPTLQKQADDIVCSIISKLQEDKEASEEEKSPLKVEIADETTSEVSKNENKNASAKSKKKSGSAKSTTVVVQEPKEPMFCGCNAVCVVSQAVAKVGSEVKGIPLYEHIASLYFGDLPFQFSCPIPMMTVLSSGKAAPGKQNLVKEVLVIAKPGLSFSQSLDQLTQVYQQVIKLHFSKVGASAYYTNDFGGVCPQFDRPDQLLDHMTETLAALGLTSGEDIFIGLNCAAHELYDPDKGKYEIMSGTLKTAEDMLEVYADIIVRYPGVIALIDPLKAHDVTALKSLCSQISEKCLIIGDHIYPRPEKFRLRGFEDLELNGSTLKLQQMTSVTDVVETSKIIHGSECVSVVAGVQGDTTDPFLADLAVGVQATFVKFGAPTRGERVALYNRLGKIADELASKDCLISRTEFPFRAIHQPEPKPEDDEDSLLSKD